MSPHAALRCCTGRRSGLLAALWDNDMPSRHQHAPLQASGSAPALPASWYVSASSHPPKPQLLLPLSSAQQAAYEVLHLPEMQGVKTNDLSVRNSWETFLDKRNFQVSPEQ